MLAPHGAPARALAVKRSTSIITVPVGVEGVAHDGQADPWTVVDDGHAATLVKVGELVAGNPTARVTPAHIAPAIPAHAAVHVHLYVRRNAVDHRKIVSGTR